MFGWLAVGVGLGGGSRACGFRLCACLYARCATLLWHVRICEFSLLSTVVTFPATEAIPATSVTVWRGNEGAGVVATLDACSPRCLPPGRL